jgi:hypothetical protein
MSINFVVFVPMMQVLKFGGSIDFEETFWNNLFGKEQVSQIQG